MAKTTQKGTTAAQTPPKKRKPKAKKARKRPRKPPIASGLAPPATFTDPERAVWVDALALLEATGDGTALANPLQLEIYAREVVRMRAAEKHVAEFGSMVPAKRTGLPIRNPHLAIGREAAAVVARLSKALGLQAAKTKPATKPMSLNAYAKIRGVSARAVSKAVQSGRLVRSIVYVREKPKIGSVALADQEWADNTRAELGSKSAGVAPARLTDGASSDLTYAEARRRSQVEHSIQARLKTETDALDLAKRKGELIEVAEARETVIDAYTIVRTNILAVPTKCAQHMPELTDKVVAAFDAALREALEELSTDD